VVAWTRRAPSDLAPYASPSAATAALPPLAREAGLAFLRAPPVEAEFGTEAAQVRMGREAALVGAGGLRK
jgi:hypothetical protein